MRMVALVQTQVLMAMPVPNMENRLIFSTMRLGRFLMVHSGIGLLVCEAMVTLASHLQDASHMVTWPEATVVENAKRRGSMNLQHVLPEAPLPLSLAEEVIEVAGECDGNKPKSEESENPWWRQRAGFPFSIIYSKWEKNWLKREQLIHIFLASFPVFFFRNVDLEIWTNCHML